MMQIQASPIRGAIVIRVDEEGGLPSGTLLIAITDSDGHYAIVLPDSPELVTMKASKLGYWSDTKEAYYEGGPLQLFRADLYLEPFFPDPVSIPETVVSQSSSQSQQIQTQQPTTPLFFQILQRLMNIR